MAEACALTDAETGVLALIGEGPSSRRIAAIRETSPETVNTQVKSLLARAAADNRVQLLCLSASSTRPCVGAGRPAFGRGCGKDPWAGPVVGC